MLCYATLYCAIFSLPTGSSMADFRKLVLGFVERKLGPGDRSKLVRNIMDVADVNKDAKVTF